MNTKLNRSVLMNRLNEELSKQGKEATVKSKNEYIDSLIDSLLMTADEYIEEDVRIESLLEKK